MRSASRGRWRRRRAGVCGSSGRGWGGSPRNSVAAGRVVIAGHAAAVERAVAVVAAAGGKAIPLKVSAPFHCALMAPAKVPHEVVARLEKVCLDILAKDEFRKKLVIAGFDVTAKDGKGHEARIAKEIPMFKKIIEDAKIAKL